MRLTQAAITLSQHIVSDIPQVECGGEILSTVTSKGYGLVQVIAKIIWAVILIYYRLFQAYQSIIMMKSTE